MNKHPIAINEEKVGEYPSFTGAGGGRFYDEVLEYRVWCHSENDGYCAFVTYEEALSYSRAHPTTAKEPLALVRQLEWIDEPKKGVFAHKKGNRITEWRVDWLKENKRFDDSIELFIASA
jgi:hypothetical protein